MSYDHNQEIKKKISFETIRELNKCIETVTKKTIEFILVINE